MKQKKQWQKPALIVLVRRKPEEAVLEGCKSTLQYVLSGCLSCGHGYGDLSSSAILILE